jgi:hypothetical protein
MDQVNHYAPPPNPAKVTDSRFESYLAEYGSQSWELDALEPSVINALITDHVAEYRDEDIWADSLARQEDDRAILNQIVDDLEG